MHRDIMTSTFRQNAWLEDLAAWSLLVSRYENRTKKNVSDDVKVSVLLENAPAAIKDQLALECDQAEVQPEVLAQRIVNFIQFKADVDRCSREEARGPRRHGSRR